MSMKNQDEKVKSDARKLQMRTKYECKHSVMGEECDARRRVWMKYVKLEQNKLKKDSQMSQSYYKDYLI